MLALDTKLGNTSSRLEQTEERLRDTVEKYRALAAEHRETLRAKAEVEDTLAVTEQALAEARTRNAELYAINEEILEHSKDKSSWTSFLQREPLLGLKQVEIENIEQDLRHRNEDQRLKVEITYSAIACYATPRPATSARWSSRTAMFRCPVQLKRGVY